ncbi:MAG: Maf-like protein [Dokdonia sp.]|jgi:septum formation protein|tara:strand:+ start:131 stop:712 length:582 start_codon:yes stop_codon:yes gene_type:complete
MLARKLAHKNIILASGSPRRQQFFKELDIAHTIVVRAVKEDFPDTLKESEITDYLAKLKATAFTDLGPDDVLVTSDTIVWHNDRALNKPQNREEALQMIGSLSGKTHKVITSVAFTMPDTQIVINDTTKVTFKTLSEEEIIYYVDHFEPYDKAGGYGVQEWFGYIAVTHIEGSYFNVMGMPLHKVYETLSQLE